MNPEIQQKRTKGTKLGMHFVAFVAFCATLAFASDMPPLPPGWTHPAKIAPKHVQRAAQTFAVASVPTSPMFITRLQWSQPDACTGWGIFGYSNNVPVLVTNILRPLYGDTWTFTIASPYSFNVIRSYNR